MQTFKLLKYKIETSYQKSSFIRKPELINVHAKNGIWIITGDI